MNMELLSLIFNFLAVVIVLHLIFNQCSKIGHRIGLNEKASPGGVKSFSIEAKQLLLNLIWLGPFERFSAHSLEARVNKTLSPRAFGFANAISAFAFIPGALLTVAVVYTLTITGYFAEIRVLLGNEVQEIFIFLQDRSFEKLFGLFLVATLLISLMGRSFVFLVAALVLLLSFIISVPGAVVLVLAEATGLRIAQLFRKQSSGMRNELGVRLLLWLAAVSVFFLFGNQMLYLTQGVFTFQTMQMQRLMPWIFNLGIVLFLDTVFSLTVLHFYYQKLSRKQKLPA